MTREEAIKKLKDILEEATETDDSVCYVTSDDADVLKLAIKALEYVERDDVLELLGEEPEIDKIRAKIEQIADEEQEYDEQWARGLRYATTIIDDYKAESKVEE
jgi:spore coat polysaccharide biosynthesis protein SpsF (cytidylyltransferase family)